MHRKSKRECKNVPLTERGSPMENIEILFPEGPFLHIVFNIFHALINKFETVLQLET